MDPHRDHTRGGFGNGDHRVSAPDACYDSDTVTVPEFLSDIPEVRHELAEYYRAIGRVDRGLGLIMDTLRKNGFDENTMVIFMSDNGPPFLNSKTTLYDAGIRLPLIIRQPGCGSGSRNPNMVSYIDILPTILDWAGYKDVKQTDPPRLGRSLLPIRQVPRSINRGRECLDPTHSMKSPITIPRDFSAQLDTSTTETLLGNLIFPSLQTCTPPCHGRGFEMPLGQ